MPYLRNLRLAGKGRFTFVRSHRQIPRGDILFILSCDRILSKACLSRNKNNIVIHASDLPKGRGWSPWTWEVESGSNRLVLTLFEADQGCDTGGYYFKKAIRLDGSELVGQIREKLAATIIKMIREYLRNYPMQKKPQKGEPTFYRKRTPQDSELDINQSIRSQFNRMRIADNERYPLYFKYKGKKYTLKIYKNG